MPKVSDIPRGLRAFTSHGVDISPRSTDTQAVGRCPFCDSEKFYVNQENGLFSCKRGSCGVSGNAVDFLRLFYERSLEISEGAEADRKYEILSANRKLKVKTLRAWGVVLSLTTGEWLVPGYGSGGHLDQLYRYMLVPDKGGMVKRLIPTSGVWHDGETQRLFAPREWAVRRENVTDQTGESNKSTILVAEGAWDGMALWEVLTNARSVTPHEGNGHATTTDSPTNLFSHGLAYTKGAGSVLEVADIIAVPGCNVFNEVWKNLFTGKNAVLLYHNDHPPVHVTRSIIPAGYAGMKRVTGMLAAGSAPPRSISYLKWGVEGYDPSLPAGYDLRDAVSISTTTGERIKSISDCLKRVSPAPADWTEVRSAARASSGKMKLEPASCQQWDVLEEVWKKALVWTEGLRRGLIAMLASILSTKAVGDQLWLKLVGPPSSGKTSLCEALGIAKKFVTVKSMIKGFHSGYKTDKEGTEDHSLIAKLYDRTLVIKDADTLIQLPNLPQILSELRDIYDTTSRSDYKNATARDHEGVRMTVILAGTKNLRVIDRSDLGERFLDVVIMEDIDDDMEDEVLARVARRANKNLSCEANGKAESQYDPDMAKAMQLTGGYVCYLRENAQRLLDNCKMDTDAERVCTRLGKFVAFMRAKRGGTHNKGNVSDVEEIGREFAARLVSQHVRLARCLAVVLNKKSVDSEVLKQTTQVALDTARGRSLEICRHLYLARDGLETRQVAGLVIETEAKTRSHLGFLRKLGVVETFAIQSRVGIKTKPRWRLTTKLRKLWLEVCGE